LNKFALVLGNYFGTNYFRLEIIKFGMLYRLWTIWGEYCLFGTGHGEKKMIILLGDSINTSKFL